MSEEMSIGDVSRRTAMAASAIRFYESEGLLGPVARRSGRRVFEQSVCDRIAFIRLAQDAGFTIPEIATLLHGFPPGARAATRWKRFVAAKRDELRRKAEKLARMRALLDILERCDCPDLDACGAAARHHVDATGTAPE